LGAGGRAGAHDDPVLDSPHYTVELLGLGLGLHVLPVEVVLVAHCPSVCVCVCARA
jgi:hypothetical protein